MSSSSAEGGLSWEAAKALWREKRPTRGDKVKILETSQTRNYFPKGIGRVFEITGDLKDSRPYWVNGCDNFLYEFDVEPLKDGIILSAIFARLSREGALAAVQEKPKGLEYVSEAWRGDREVVLAAVRKNGFALQYATDDPRKNREIVLTAVRENGNALQYATDDLRKDREIVLTAVRNQGLSLEYAGDDLRKDREMVLTAVRKDGGAVQYVSDKLLQDHGVRQVVIAAVQERPDRLEHVSEAWRADREVVLTAVRQNGLALQHANGELRKDRDVVTDAIKSKTMQSGHRPNILKLALPPLNQDSEMLEVAGLALERPPLIDGQLLPEVVLSVKFSLFKEASNLANELYLEVKKSEGFKRMYVHNPNVFRKGFCGLTHTNTTSGEPDDVDEEGRNVYGWGDNTLGWKCRGDCGVTCWKRKEDPAHICERDHPGDPLRYGCWRLVYRRHLQKAKDTGGCMLQLEEWSGLGVGQQVEREMARQVGVEVIVLEQGWGIRINKSHVDKVAELIAGRPSERSDFEKDFYDARVYRLGDPPGVEKPAGTANSSSAAPPTAREGSNEDAPREAAAELDTTGAGGAAGLAGLLGAGDGGGKRGRLAKWRSQLGGAMQRGLAAIGLKSRPRDKE